MKCLTCGKPAKINNLCKQCFLDRYTNVQGFRKFNLNICVFCGSYSYGVQFKPSLEFDGALRKAIIANTEFERKPSDININVKLPHHTKKRGTKLNIIADILIRTEFKVDNSTIVKEEEYQLPILVKYTICDKCRMASSKYFEGRIQLRNDESSEFENAAEYIRNKIEKKKNVFITKEEKVKNGIDFYITSQKFIQVVGNEMARKFGGELKITSSLHTKERQTSKDVYRVDVLFRLTDFNVGDILEINKKLLLVKNITGRIVSGTDLKNNNLYASENYTTHEYKISAGKDDYLETTVVKHKPKLEVLHPHTYQAVKVENPKEVKDKVNVVIIDDKIYAV